MDRRKPSHSRDRAKNNDEMRHRGSDRRDRTPDNNNQRRDGAINLIHELETVAIGGVKESTKVASRQTKLTKTRSTDKDRLETVEQSDRKPHRQSVSKDNVNRKELEQSTSKRLSKKSNPVGYGEKTNNGKKTELEGYRRHNSDYVKQTTMDISNRSIRNVALKNQSPSSHRGNVERKLESPPKLIRTNDPTSHSGDEYEEDFEDYESDFDKSISDNDVDNDEIIMEDDGDAGYDNDVHDNHDDNIQHPDDLGVIHTHSNTFQMEETSTKPSMPLFNEHLPNGAIMPPISLSPNDTLKVSFPGHHQPDKVDSFPSEEQSMKKHHSEISRQNSKDSERPFVKHPAYHLELTPTSCPKNKTIKRGEELLDLIKLDNIRFGLFSLPPRTYDEFMRSFGNDNSKQAYTQTRDENEEEETQTDPIELTEAWTQHPPGIHGAGGGKQLSLKNGNAYVITSTKDWKRLGRFLHHASQIMCSLLEEERNEAHDSGLISINKDVSFSEMTLYLRPPLFLQGYSTLFVSSCRLQPHFILVIYSKDSPKLQNGCLDRRNVTCVWDLNQPSAPQRILISSCQPICCCFSQSAEFAFAGFEDGSVAVWDLREPDSLHQRSWIDEDEYVLRSPTYSTAEVLRSDAHLSAVVAILCRADRNPTSNYIDSAYYKDDIIQLATLEEDGVLCLWVLSQMSRPEAIGNETDLGLAPGGKVHLVKSSSVRLQNIPKLQQHLQTFPSVKDFACQAHDANRFYVTTDTGLVVTCTMHDEKSTIFAPSEGTSAIAEANSISFAINGEPQCFLVGCEDGSVRLHSIGKEKPLMTWTTASKTGEAIHKVAWSDSCPNVFYLLDCLGHVHVWDLCESDCEPASSTSSTDKRVVHFDVGSDRRLWNEADKPYIVFGCDDGMTEVHYINERYTRRGARELQMFRKYVELL